MGTQSIVDADREWRKAAKLAEAKRKSGAQLDAEIAASLRGANPVAQATDATDRARKASDVANRGNAAGAHRTAAQAHRQAEALHRTNGHPRAAAIHAETAREHERRAARGSF